MMTGSFQPRQLGFSNLAQFSGSEKQTTGSILENDGGSSNNSGDANKIVQVFLLSFSRMQLTPS